MQSEQLVLRPVPAFLEAFLVSPRAARWCRPRRPTAKRRKRNPRGIRYLPGTAPTVHLPMAGTERTRRNRDGHKPGSMKNNGIMTQDEADVAVTDQKELGDEGVRFGPPATLGECPDDPNEPCGHVGCSANLYLDVLPPRRAGELPIIKLNFPGLDIDEIPETCALRVANRVGYWAKYEGKEVPKEEIGKIMNLTMGRVDQLDHGGVRKCADQSKREGWGEDWRRVLARA